MYINIEIKTVFSSTYGKYYQQLHIHTDGHKARLLASYGGVVLCVRGDYLVLKLR